MRRLTPRPFDTTARAAAAVFVLVLAAQSRADAAAPATAPATALATVPATAGVTTPVTSPSSRVAELRRERIVTLRRARDYADGLFVQGVGGSDGVYRLSEELLRAELSAAESADARSAVLQESLALARNQLALQRTRVQAGMTNQLGVLQATAYALDIEIQIEQARADKELGAEKGSAQSQELPAPPTPPAHVSPPALPARAAAPAAPAPSSRSANASELQAKALARVAAAEAVLERFTQRLQAGEPLSPDKVEAWMAAQHRLATARIDAAPSTTADAAAGTTAGAAARIAAAEQYVQQARAARTTLQARQGQDVGALALAQADWNIADAEYLLAKMKAGAAADP